MSLFSKSEVNTTRQFEFDFAKAVCILGMVFVHCFEEIPLVQSSYSGNLYYAFVTVLDAIFGAGTFMICLGIGLTYTKKNQPKDFIRRGIKTLIIGYILNVLRFSLPGCTYFYFVDKSVIPPYFLGCTLFTDIMQFAGLAFILFGLLKALKLPDFAICLLSLSMSLVGTFVRFIDVGPFWLNEIVGLFIGTVDSNPIFPYSASFPLVNWFIFVIFGYFFGKLIKRCEKKELFYLIASILSVVVLTTYMVITIPRKIGMMSGDTSYYFQMTTPESFIIMFGAVFAFCLYHYISKLFSQRVKDFITRLSFNMNKTYIAHWIITGCLGSALWYFFYDGLSIGLVCLIAVAIYVVSSLIGEFVQRRCEKKREVKINGENQG